MGSETVWGFRTSRELETRRRICPVVGVVGFCLEISKTNCINRKDLLRILQHDTSSMNKYRDETAKICKMKGWDKAPISVVWMLLNEEMGELASSIRQTRLIYKKTGLKKDKGIDVVMEMGDVFSYLFQLAHMLNIDMDTMWELHRQKVQTKVYKENNVRVY